MGEAARLVKVEARRFERSRIVTIAGYGVTMTDDPKAVQIPGWMVGALGTVTGLVLAVVGFLMFFDGRYAPARMQTELAGIETRLEGKADADEAATKAELLLVDQRVAFTAATLERIERKVDAVGKVLRTAPPGPRQAKTPGAPAEKRREREERTVDELERELDEILRELERRREHARRRTKPPVPPL